MHSKVLGSSTRRRCCDTIETIYLHSTKKSHIRTNRSGLLWISYDHEHKYRIHESVRMYPCMSKKTRLIHLELVENMTTEAFLNALRRFFARRRVPQSITCDYSHIFAWRGDLARYHQRYGGEHRSKERTDTTRKRVDSHHALSILAVWILR